MTAPLVNVAIALTCLLFVLFLARLLLRSMGRIGPHRDIEADWSVRSPAAREEARRVDAQMTALHIEAGIQRRDYVPPERQGGAR